MHQRICDELGAEKFAELSGKSNIKKYFEYIFDGMKVQNKFDSASFQALRDLKPEQLNDKMK